MKEALGDAAESSEVRHLYVEQHFNLVWYHVISKRWNTKITE